MKELTGQRFGNLIAIRATDQRQDGNVLWECLCDCGNKKLVKSSCLTSGHTVSCGCRQAKDLTGQRFGKLVAIRPTEERQWGSVLWECQCDCGNKVLFTVIKLTSGTAISCGCIKRKRISSKRKDLTGQRFGKLTVLRATSSLDRKNVVWECECDCGNKLNVRTYLLTSGNTQSCGCLRTEKRRHIKDLTGQRFGKVVAIRRTGERSKYGVMWECLCDCGNLTYISSDRLSRSGHAQSCGCLLKKQEEIKDAPQSDNKTGYKGIYFTKGNYLVSILLRGKRCHLGTFNNLEDAIAQRKKADEILCNTEYFRKWNAKAQADPEWAKNNPIGLKLQRNGKNDYSISLIPEL